MIVSQQQRKNLRKYLSEGFSYREIITEVYDHILSAAERYEGDLLFQDAVNNIIKTDFGGVDKLRDLEKRFKAAAADEIRSRIWGKFQSNLKSWGLAFGFVFFLLGFRYQVGFADKNLVMFIMLILAAMQMLLDGLRRFRSGYLYGNQRKSVKDRILLNIAAIPMRFILAIILLNTVYAKHLLGVILPNLQFGIILILYTALSTFLISYYQCFNKEYRSKATHN